MDELFALILLYFFLYTLNQRGNKNEPNTIRRWKQYLKSKSLKTLWFCLFSANTNKRSTNFHTIKERKNERNSIFPDIIYKLNWLPVDLKECGHIKKLLSRSYMDKVPSKTATCWKRKDLRLCQIESLIYLK